MKTLISFLLTITFSCGTLLAQFEGQALQFNGIEDYVSFGNSAVFDVDTAVTYEAWIRPDTTSGFIFNKWVNFQEDKQLTYSGDKVTFYMHNVFSGVSLVSASSVPLHQYTHVAATYDGAIAKLYINGVLDTSKSVGNPVSNSAGVLYLAHNPDRFDNQSAFMGVIDEFRIWNIARTESEIQSTMNQTLHGNEPGLIGYWNFNEGTGSTTADQTINGNDGTISGAIWVPGITSVKDEVNSPASYILSQNYPNPFNPATKIDFKLPSASNVKIIVNNILGQKVRELLNGRVSAGEHTISFNAGNLASGIYIYQIVAENIIDKTFFRTTKKMILLK